MTKGSIEGEENHPGAPPAAAFSTDPIGGLDPAGVTSTTAVLSVAAAEPEAKKISANALARRTPEEIAGMAPGDVFMSGKDTGHHRVERGKNENGGPCLSCRV